MTPDFKIGELLELEPNGPAMRAVEIKDDHVVCQWHSKSGTLQTAEFPQACVRKRPEIDMNLAHSNQRQDIYSDWEGFVQSHLDSADEKKERENNLPTSPKERG